MNGFNVAEIVGNSAEEGIQLDQYSVQTNAFRLSECNRNIVIPFAPGDQERPRVFAGTLLEASPKRLGQAKERHLARKGNWPGAFLRAKSSKIALDGLEPLYVPEAGAAGLPSYFGVLENPENVGRACYARASAQNRHDALYVLYPDRTFVCVDENSRAGKVTWDGHEFALAAATREEVAELYYATAMHSTYGPFVSTLMRGIALLEHAGITKARRRALYTHRDELKKN